MALPNNKKEQIAQIIIQTLYANFALFENEICNKIPFEILFNEVFHPTTISIAHSDCISFSSWMHGLNSSLGQSFFESVAHILCDGEKKDFKSNTIFANQMTAIAEVMTELKNATKEPSVKGEDAILEQNANGVTQTAPNFTVDCFYETDTEVVGIELKSVRPNSGEMRGEKQKILIGKAVLRKLYPNKDVKYLFGFPFDPTSDGNTTYDKARFLSYLVEAEKFVASEDFLIADELWSFLASSEGAMQEILQIINRIATPKFMEIFDKIQNNSLNTDEKRRLLTEWYLFSELEILESVQRTSSNCRRYNQSIFKTDGSYNQSRLSLLSE